MRISPRLVRFVIIGVLNTAIDFVILFALTSAGMGLWLANIFSTSVALGFSFFANRSFTFKSTGKINRQVLPFLLVTLTGLWLWQPLVIFTVTNVIDAAWGSAIVLLIAKTLATVVSMTWNYLLYNRVVFRGKTDKSS